MTTVLPPSLILALKGQMETHQLAVSKPATQIWFPSTIPHQKVPKLFGGMVDSWDTQEKKIYGKPGSACANKVRKCSKN